MITPFALPLTKLAIVKDGLEPRSIQTNLQPPRPSIGLLIEKTMHPKPVSIKVEL